VKVLLRVLSAERDRVIGRWDGSLKPGKLPGGAPRSTPGALRLAGPQRRLVIILTEEVVVAVVIREPGPDTGLGIRPATGQR
jgi:hypothetical protein